MFHGFWAGRALTLLVISFANVGASNAPDKLRTYIGTPNSVLPSHIPHPGPNSREWAAAHAS